MTRVVKNLVIVAVLGGIMAVAGSWALAQDNTPLSADKQAKLLAKHPDADANKDGVLTQEELRAYLASKSGKAKGGPMKGPMVGMGDPAQVIKNHPEWDTNADGVLSDEEIQAGRASLMASSREDLAKKILAEHPEADLDGDGKLSPEEFMQFRAKNPGALLGLRPKGPPMSPAMVIDQLLQRFDEIDLNRDGQLSREELTQFKQKLVAAGPGGFGLGGPGREAPEALRQKILQKYPEADTDKDGKLSDEEFKAFAEQHRGVLKGAGKSAVEKKAQGDGGGKGRHGKGPKGGQQAPQAQ